jgi:hypothetical protein
MYSSTLIVPPHTRLIDDRAMLGNNTGKPRVPPARPVPIPVMGTGTKPAGFTRGSLRTRGGRVVTTVASSLSPRRRCAREGGMRTRCARSGRDGEHEWASGDDDAVAIVRLRSSSPCHCHCHERVYGGGRGGRVVTTTPWRSCGHDRRRHHVTVVITTVCGPGRGKGKGGVRTKWV